MSESRPVVLSILFALVAAGASRSQGPSQSAANSFALFTNAGLTTAGLVGSYVNQNLVGVAAPDDWRTTQTIAGMRTDAQLEFRSSSWGVRSQVGLTGGTDANWDQFSVQWDGFVQVLRDGGRLCTYSDDSSRMWIDRNGDGAFSPIELVNNHWGTPQAATLGNLSAPLAIGVYAIRIQYQAGFGVNVLVLKPGPTVRCAYLIPSNRTAQAAGVQTMRAMVGHYQTWLCEQFDRNGFVGRRLNIETEPDGVTPRVHVVSIAATDTSLHADPWTSVGAAATAAGVRIWEPGDVWLLIPESHVQQPNGSLLGGIGLGGGFGSGASAGVAMVGSAALALSAAGDMTSVTPYHGLVVPAIGPHPLVQSLSFAWFEGSTVGAVLSSLYGAALHEIGHAIGLPHDARNDDNFNGNLMYNGLRGFRGAIYPALFPNEDCRLTRFAGLFLESSPYVMPCVPVVAPAAPPADAIAPTLSVLVSGAVVPVAGLVVIPFFASDASGLSSAVLIRNGLGIEEMPLSGTTASASFATTWFDAGVSQNFEVFVRDLNGNRTTATASLAPNAAANRAPRPFLRVLSSVVGAGGSVVLDATASFDPEGQALTYEWDLDGDGLFDTPPSSSPVLTTSFIESWPRSIRVRVTDALSARAVSAPVPVRVLPATASPSVVAFGSGTPACLGPVSLLPNLLPAQGTATFGAVTTGAPPNALGLIAFAAQAAPGEVTIPGLSQTVVLLEPSSVVLLVPVSSDFAGRSFLSLPLNGAGLAGAVVHAQSFWTAPPACGGSPDGFATSNGLTVTIF